MAATPILTDRKIRELYALLSTEMLDFDCGAECAPKNDGIPICCDVANEVPILFADELNFHKRRGGFWRRLPRPTPELKAYAAGVEDRHRKLAVCPGIAGCERKKRAFVCRQFPFEPHLDAYGNILGLTFNFDPDHRCPLIGRADVTPLPEYVRRSLLFYKKIFALFPDEQELYMHVSEKVRRRFKRKKMPVPLFTTGGNP